VDDDERHKIHSTSRPVDVPGIRTVLLNADTDNELGFWDAPLWVPIGGLIDTREGLWIVVAVRLRLPRTFQEGGSGPFLYWHFGRAGGG